MSNLKRRHQDTSQIPNSDIPNTTPSTSDTDVYDTSFFPLSETRFPLGTPIQSKRSRKNYSDLAHEREFLLHIKGLWESKLANLKEDKKLLERMKSTKKHELVDEEPLFRPAETLLQPIGNDLQQETDTTDSTAFVDLENQENEHDSFEILNGPEVIKEPGMLATLAELDRIYSDVQNAPEQEDSSEEEETEEEARKALHKMLEEFGGGF